VFRTFLVADDLLCPCVSDGGVFGVKIGLIAREKCCRGFVDFCVGKC
jgi:hypothetical protein